MTKVAVIIPYYQKRAGILRRALNSVLTQRLSPEVEIEVIVTDDGSPIPVDGEIDGLAFIPPFSLTVKKQANAGVSAARNTCLNSVTPDTTYIAFLDSDDIWEPEHLATAIDALDRGCDFYFCDNQRDEWNKTAFEQFNFAHFLNMHAKNIGAGLYHLEQSQFFDLCLRDRPFQTSATVYRRQAVPKTYFDETLRSGGEDCLFYFEVVQKCQRICSCTNRVVRCAEGVNLHIHDYNWDSADHLLRNMGQLIGAYKAKKRLLLSASNRDFMTRKIRNIRAKFAFFTIRYFIKKREAWSPELRGMVRNDHGFWLWYPFYCLYVSVCFPLRLYDPLKNW